VTVDNASLRSIDVTFLLHSKSTLSKAAPDRWSPANPVRKVQFKLSYLTPTA